MQVLYLAAERLGLILDLLGLGARGAGGLLEDGESLGEAALELDRLRPSQNTLPKGGAQLDGALGIGLGSIVLFESNVHEGTVAPDQVVGRVIFDGLRVVTNRLLIGLAAVGSIAAVLGLGRQAHSSLLLALCRHHWLILGVGSSLLDRHTR